MLSLREKFTYSEFFLSIFYCIQTEYGGILYLYINISKNDVFVSCIMLKFNHFMIVAYISLKSIIIFSLLSVHIRNISSMYCKDKEGLVLMYRYLYSFSNYSICGSICNTDIVFVHTGSKIVSITYPFIELKGKLFRI